MISAVGHKWASFRSLNGLDAQRKPSISPRQQVVVPQRLQILEKPLKAAPRATGAVHAHLVAHPNRLRASRIHDPYGDGQQHAGP